MTVDLFNGVLELTGSNGNDIFNCYQTGSKLTVEEGTGQGRSPPISATSINEDEARERGVGHPTRRFYLNGNSPAPTGVGTVPVAWSIRSSRSGAGRDASARG
jgi:hypothetical protein